MTEVKGCGARGGGYIVGTGVLDCPSDTGDVKIVTISFDFGDFITSAQDDSVPTNNDSLLYDRCRYGV